MKKFEELKLEKREKQALLELKKKILKKYPNAEIILYGSRARGDFRKDSDIDLFILVESQVNATMEEDIFHISYEIELKHNVVFGEIIENRDYWKTPLAKVMPIHFHIDKEGVQI